MAVTTPVNGSTVATPGTDDVKFVIVVTSEVVSSVYVAVTTVSWTSPSCRLYELLSKLRDTMATFALAKNGINTDNKVITREIDDIFFNIVDFNKLNLPSVFLFFFFS